jgi:hypothetical protein
MVVALNMESMIQDTGASKFVRSRFLDGKVNVPTIGHVRMQPVRAINYKFQRCSVPEDEYALVWSQAQRMVDGHKTSICRRFVGETGLRS